MQTLDESQVTAAIYDGLTEFDFSDKTNPVLKARWPRRTNAGHRVHLHHQARQTFSNGARCCRHFKYAWNRNGQADFASPYAT